MGEVNKTIYVYGIAALLEGSYGAGGSPSVATDGILLAENPEVQPEYANDGARPMPPGTMGYQPRAVPSGRIGKGTFKVMVAGAGAAFSASVKPRAHNLLRAAGFDSVLDATPGSEKYTYTPTPGPTGYGSGVIDLYSRGEKTTLSGTYLDFQVGADGDVIPTMEFAAQGLLSLPTDVSCPAIAYDSLVGPKSVGAILTLGNATGLILRKWQYKHGREIVPRVNQNTAAGHAGFASGKRTPTLELTVEATARQGAPYTAAGAIDPDQLFANATSLAWSIGVLGATQYNKVKYSGPAAQLAAPPKWSNDGPTALWTVSLQLNPSALNANDEITIQYT